MLIIAASRIKPSVLKNEYATLSPYGRKLWETMSSFWITEAEMVGEPEMGVRRDAPGVHSIGRLEHEIQNGEIIYADSGPVRVMVTEKQVGATSDPTLKDLSEALTGVYGSDFDNHSPSSISRFTYVTR